MPPLKRKTNLDNIREPGKIPMYAETEVLVVGAGPSGLGAAIGAASAGADTILVEQYGFIGGAATIALVIPWAHYYTSQAIRREGQAAMLIPTALTEGEPVIAGVFELLIDRLVAVGGAIPASAQTGYNVPFEPEILKLEGLKLLDEAGVKFLFHSLAYGTLGEDEVKGVIFHTKSGPIAIRARVAIDCTGDADIAAFAGAKYEMGREKDGLMQPASLLFKLAGVKREEFNGYVLQHPSEWNGVQGLRELVRKAIREEHFDLKREDILFFDTVRPDEILVNSTRMGHVNGANVLDLTYAEWEGRRQLEQIVRFFREYVPGFKNAYISQSAARVGVRETRRIIGKYQLTKEDVLQARKFDDVVARGAYPIDIHDPRGEGTVIQDLPMGEAYDIPLRCLIPQDVKNLLVAGRCISGTHEAQSSFRVMPICMATGHAAGVCAALAAKQNKSPDSVAANDVQQELLRQGANLRGIGKATNKLSV